MAETSQRRRGGLMRMAEATPPDRDRYVDFLRGFSIVVVVLGHWLMGMDLTLLSMIGCLARPTSGRILLHGRNLSGLPERFLTGVRRQTFGFTFQRFNLIQGLSVLDNVMLPAFPLAPDHAELVARAQALLDQFGLAPKAAARVEWLSGGEAQRTAICRALINDPEVLIADEPTANLDSHLAQDFLTLLEGLRAAGRTLILSSHDAEVFEAPCVDRVVTLRDGAVVDG